MRNWKLLMGILLSAVLVAGCNFNHNAIIKVNNEVITQQQYDEAFNSVAQVTPITQLGVDLRNDPDNYIHLMIKEKVVNDLIIKKLLDQEMQKRHIKVSSEDMEKQYQTLVEKIGGKEKFEEVLRQNQISQGQFKKELKEEVKMQKLVSTLGVVNVSDRDVEKYYKKNINSFKYPDKVRASHILVMADPVQITSMLMAKKENQSLSKEEIEKKVNDEMTARKQKAQTILAELKKNPKDFAKLAKENSDDTVSAAEGGDLGFFTKDTMVEEFSNAAFSQKPNTISEIVTSPYGYHIIMVTDRMKAGIEPFDKVKFQLKNYLEQQEKTQLLQKFVENVKNTAKIEYIDNSYNPAEIDKKLKEAQAKNPSLMGEQSATE